MAVHAAAIPLAAIIKFVLGGGATIGTLFAVNLSITVVRDRARQESPNRKLTVRREREGDFIRIVLEGSGKPAVWLTEKLDQALEDLLPEGGAPAEI